MPRGDRLLSLLGTAGAGLDTLFLRVAFRGRRTNRRADVDLEKRDQVLASLAEAASLYGGAAADGRLFPCPAAAPPVAQRRGSRLPDGWVVDLQWPSGWRHLHPSAGQVLGASPRNATARARWLHHARPACAVLCIHGWGGGAPRIDAYAFRARWIYQQGLDVLLVTLPLHGARGSNRGRLPRFPSPNPFVTNDGIAQAVWDLRCLLRWLLARGAPAVGACGMSFGGFVTALLATVEPRLAFAAPLIPAACLIELMWHHGRGGSARRRAESLGLTLRQVRPAFEPTSPLARRPVIPAGRVVVVAGARDRVIPMKHPRRLAEHFGAGPVVTFPGSHLLQAGKHVMLQPVVDLARHARPGGMGGLADRRAPMPDE